MFCRNCFRLLILFLSNCKWEIWTMKSSFSCVLWPVFFFFFCHYKQVEHFSHLGYFFRLSNWKKKIKRIRSSSVNSNVSKTLYFSRTLISDYFVSDTAQITNILTLQALANLMESLCGGQKMKLQIWMQLSSHSWCGKSPQDFLCAKNLNWSKILGVWQLPHS